MRSGVSSAASAAAARDSGKVVRVADAADVAERTFLVVDVDGIEIGVTRVGDAYFAIRNICPHQQAPICLGKVMPVALPSQPDEVRFDRSTYAVVCQRHQWEFSLDSGEVLYTTARGRLRTYRVTVREGGVFVDLGGRPPRAPAQERPE
jgi:nitrite reductase/ring-hydroxylating ferredoxin subunit